MKGDELLVLLGKVTANGQALEIATCLLLGRCLALSVDDGVAIRLGQRLPMAGRLELVTELAELDGCPLDKAAVRDWLVIARKANEKRNTIIHSAWLGDHTIDEFGGALTKKGRHEPRWGKTELQDTIDQLRRAIVASERLLRGEH